MTPIYRYASAWQLADIIDLVMGVTLILAWTIAMVAEAMDRRGYRG